MLLFTPIPNSKQIKVACLLIPGFSMIGFSALVDPLRQANSLSGADLYSWQVLSVKGEPVLASNGMALLPNCGVQQAEPFDLLLVCAGFEPELGYTNELGKWLQQVSRKGLWLGSQDTGSLLLAKAGLLNGMRATIHWENLVAFKEVFRRVKVVDELYEVDGKRMTCSGGMAGLDMMLYMIESQRGHALALGVSDELIYGHVRDSKSPQRMHDGLRHGTNNGKVIAVIHCMENNLEEPLSIPELARSVSISERELERLFNRHIQQSPGRFYRHKRLQKARALLQQTDQQVVEIAVACGFASAAHFTRSYKQYFGVAPSRDRVQQVRLA
ncbi:MAG: GlxA family transcriptional regulator [Gammaproteobacteria bacterium]|nr:GlxA family transcriptional regulator [Gammaproteobacteria bacterium]